MIKRFIYRFICYRPINFILRSLLKPFSQSLPARVISRVPVVGKISIQLPNSEKVLVLTSDGGDPIASSLYWGGLKSFEYETIKLYLQLLKHTRVVFDIGANTGLFALLAAIDSQDRDVHAFEPVPEIFDYLKKNVAANNLHNLKSVCNAVTDFDGEIELYIPYSVVLPTSSSTLKGFREAYETFTVPALKVDTYVATNHILGVELLKIDTEGTEHKVLEGAKRVLERDEPVIICEVLKGRTESRLQNVLAHYNYEFFLITDDGLVKMKKIEGDEIYIYRNFLFITPDKIQKYLQGVTIS